MTWWDSVLDTEAASASRSELSKAYSKAARTLGSDRLEFAQQEIVHTLAIAFLANRDSGGYRRRKQLGRGFRYFFHYVA